MPIHEIRAVRENLHGTFSPDIPPILEIDPGDSVVFETLDAGWGLEAMRSDGTARRTLQPRDEVFDAGHAMCGPVAVRGAKPGDTLVVRIDELRTGTFGYNGSSGPNPTRVVPFGLSVDTHLTLRWELDREKMIATNHLGHKVAMRPFLGVMGLPPAEPGHHPTAPPRVTGGNLDCKELVPGAKLFLPVAVEGALFSTGDGHAVQGDGELSGTAIECPMERAVLTFDLLSGVAYDTPRALTPDAWITFGVDEDLDAAMYQATNAMLDMIMDMHGVDRAVALALASLAVDLRVTQVVNGVKGVHAMLPHGAIR